MRYILIMGLIYYGAVLQGCSQKEAALPAKNSAAPATNSSQSVEQYDQSQGVKTPQLPQPNTPAPPSQPQSRPMQATQPVQDLKAAQPAGDLGTHTFIVYTVKGVKDDHFIPSGWMGDYGDVMMNDKFSGNCHSSNGCVRFTYSAQKNQGVGWAGVYWQNPANNWGDQQGGYNLAGIKKLTFWARGEKGGEQIEKFVVGGVTGKYPDSTKVEMGPVKLTAQWKKYSIDLTGRDLSYISGGFGWVTSAGLNPEGCTFYLDSIEFEGEPVSAGKEK